MLSTHGSTTRAFWRKRSYHTTQTRIRQRHSTGPLTPLFTPRQNVSAQYKQNEDLDVFNTSKQGQEYFRKSYASSQGRSDNQVKSLLFVTDSYPRVYKALIKNNIEGQLSSDLLLKLKRRGHRDRGHLQGFRRANKHKPRKLKFSSDEEVDLLR